MATGSYDGEATAHTSGHYERSHDYSDLGDRRVSGRRHWAVEQKLSILRDAFGPEGSVRTAPGLAGIWAGIWAGVSCIFSSAWERSCATKRLGSNPNLEESWRPRHHCLKYSGEVASNTALGNQEIALNYDPQTLLSAIGDASTQGLAVTPEPGVLTGYAGAKLTGLLQRIPRVIGGDYMEVGVFQGCTLLSTALANPEITCFGVDNYSMHDPDNLNRPLVVSRAERLGIANYRLIDKDFEDGLLGFDGEVGTFFVDGPHDYRSQLVCLGYAPRFLKRGGVILVDDANYAHVRRATADFLIMFPEFKLVFEAYTRCHPSNMTAAEEAEARNGWWDGVHVIVHDPEDKFVGLTPPAPGNARFIRDHDVQIVRYGHWRSKLPIWSRRSAGLGNFPKHSLAFSAAA